MDVYAVPHDDGAERIVLGAMMLDRAAATRGVDLLRVEDFYRPAHTAIFGRIAAGVLGGEPVDPAAVAARLGPDLERTGGASYLHDLVSCVPVAANLGWYARIVADRALMRRLAEAGQAIVHIGLDMSREPGDAMALAAKHLAAVTDLRQAGGPVRWRELIGPALASIERASQMGATPGLSTGLALLDAMTGGLRGGQLVVVAGRPGMGKSVVALDWARRAAFHAGVAAIVFSLEMGRNEIFNRLVAAESQTSLARITRGWLDESQWTAIVGVAGATETAPLYVDDVAPVRLHDVVARARRLHACDRLGLIVVDYLQLLTTGGRAESREREVAEISRTLKLLAKELDVPVIAVSQLNRGVEQRGDKRPVLSDLRESGSVEQDSDIVVLLYRDDYYNAESLRAREIDLIVAKHRSGPQGTVVGVTDFPHSRILDPHPATP